MVLYELLWIAFIFGWLACSIKLFPTSVLIADQFLISVFVVQNCDYIFIFILWG